MKSDIKIKVDTRLKIIEGQIRGLAAMVEDDEYCIDIITQASAIRQAISGIEYLMLENHLATHVLHQMKTGKEKQAIEEILNVYKVSQKKK
jgi:CsoR family transcriptional regulator, copper-sensing transcriptional repressor